MESLFVAGSHTVALFTRVKGVVSQTSEHARRDEWPAAELASEADRFKLWAINLGLFVRGHASLDYRVRDAESIRLVLLRFISSLNEALTEGRSSLVDVVTHIGSLTSQRDTSARVRERRIYNTRRRGPGRFDKCD